MYHAFLILFFKFRILKEFEELAKILKPDTARAMKIEVAPWIQDYVVDMNELYCELEIETVYNKIHGEETKLIDDYRKLFLGYIDQGQDSFKGKIQVCHPSKIPVPKARMAFTLASHPGNSNESIKTVSTPRKKDKEKKPGLKILFKGDPGIGKTTLLKKMGWDWAKRFFNGFSVVFMILLKLVRPDETIGKAIIHQTPILKGLKVTQQKLDRFLEKFGDKCLLLLDGLDEYVGGENTDVHKIIKGEKYLSCSVVISSRPHSIRSLEQYFYTVVRINGFTVNEVEKFATKILHNEAKVEQVMNFNPSTLAEGRFLYNYPILLSFLCLLVREDEVDLSDRTMPIGEIFTRMVRCLYKKYVIRKKKSFSDEHFLSILKKVGKLALDTLLSGNSLLRCSEVKKETGDDAFDYGLLIGREDAHILIRDETADIFVTFPHRSVQEFLGAFCFILKLNEGATVESIIGFSCTEPIFMMNPLFLHFCLWLMHYGNKYFPTLETGQAFERLVIYCADKIARLDLMLPIIASTFPALDMENSIGNKDEIMLRFFKRILLQLKNVKSLGVKSEENFDLVQPLLSDLSQTIEYVRVKNRAVTCSNNQVIIHGGDTLNKRMLQDILEMLKNHVMFPDVYVLDGGSDDFLMSLLNKLRDRHPRRLEYSAASSRSGAITKFSILPHCQHLSHLAFENVILCDKNIVAPSQAVEHGRLPSLSHLGFKQCQGLRNNVGNLFRSVWPKLVSLNLHSTRLSSSDLKKIITQTVGGEDSHKSLLPKLTSLVLSLSYTLLITDLFRQKQFTLMSIFLDIPHSSDVASIGNISQDVLPKLSRFGLSGQVLEANFPFLKLTSLSLRSLRYKCTAKLKELLNSIAKNKATLSHLELSSSKSLRCNLRFLLLSKFPSLNTLILKSTI